MRGRSTRRGHMAVMCAAVALGLGAAGPSAATGSAGDTLLGPAAPGTAAPDHGPWGLVSALEARRTVPVPVPGSPEHAARLALAASWDGALVSQLAGTPDAELDAAVAAALGPDGPSGAVLLRNDGVLPLQPGGNVAVLDAGRAAGTTGGGLISLGPDGEGDVSLSQPPAALSSVETAVAADVAVVVARATLPAVDPAGAGPAPTDPVTTGPAATDPTPVTAVAEAEAELIRQVAARNPRTVVVLLGPAAVETAAWDQDVAALVHLWDGDGLWEGTATGTERLAALLDGEIAPTGRLPVAISPAYPLGHGLAYTTFAYADLRTVDVPAAEPATATGDAPGRTVSVDVTNTGPASGTETVQVYVGPAPAEGTVHTASSLAGWAHVTLEPGQTQTVAVPLGGAALTAVGPILEVHVGASAADLRVHGTVDLGQPGPSAPEAEAPAPSVPGTEVSGDGGTHGIDGAPTSSDPAAASTPSVQPSTARSTAWVAPGPLTLTVAPGPLTLTGVEHLDDRLRLHGALPTVTVQDGREDRAGRGGWTVSGQFTDLAGAQHAVTADRLGWEPQVVTSATGLTAGPSVPTSLSGGPGLTGPAVLASAGAQTPSGSIDVGATVRLEVPADTPPGAYGGTLTLTLFPTE